MEKRDSIFCFKLEGQFLAQSWNLAFAIPTTFLDQKKNGDISEYKMWQELQEEEK